MKDEKLKKLVFTALLAALTCVATMIIRIPTPTMGYIHPGDAVVLLSGALLGPAYGAIAGGLGSALSDLFAGYIVYVPATAIIKGLTAATAGIITHTLIKKHSAHPALSVLLGGIAGESIMVIGYFLFEIVLLGISEEGGFGAAALSAGIIASAAGVPFNVVQGVFGVVVSTILYSVLRKAVK